MFTEATSQRSLSRTSVLPSNKVNSSNLSWKILGTNFQNNKTL